MVRPIRTEEDFEAALDRISSLIGASEGTPEFDESQVLACLITDYERRVRPVPEASPAEVVSYVMEERGLGVADLAIYFGDQQTASEFLAGSREITVDQIRLLCEGLRIPVAALVGSSTSRSPGDAA